METNVDEILRYIFDENGNQQVNFQTAKIAFNGIRQLCVLIQSLSSLRPHSKQITFGLYAKVESLSADSRLFTILGPDIGNDNNANMNKESKKQSIAETMPSEVNSGSDKATLILERRGRGSISEIEMRPVETDSEKIHEEIHPSRNQENSDEVDVLIESPPSGYESNLSSPIHCDRTSTKISEMSHDGIFEIPPDAVARCLSYFLDGSGCTSHPSYYKPRTVDSVNGRMLNRALKKVYNSKLDRFREGRKKRLFGVRYLSIIPPVLRGKHVRYQNIALLRGIQGEAYTARGVQEVKLEIMKSDRNRKELTFGVLSTLVHCEPLFMDKILQEISLLGLGQEGCTHFKKCGVENTEECSEKRRDVLDLFSNTVDGKKQLVGRANVDPFTTFLCGEIIGRDSIVVRFVETLTDDQTLLKYSRNHLKRPVIWKTENIRRVSLVGPLNELWGSAIVALTDTKLICTFLQYEGEGVLHVGNAILLCDVKIEPTHRNEFYPYSFWYGNTGKRMRQAHFCDDRVPIRLGDIGMKSRALLWHRKKIKQEQA